MIHLIPYVVLKSHTCSMASPNVLIFSVFQASNDEKLFHLQAKYAKRLDDTCAIQAIHIYDVTRLPGYSTV